ncbi:mucin-2-like [Plodia interpunctella]|uniref:mucin-2-like n=1 Tax=Plodia interpunctella TaxID=58824 RepID=UPI0023689B0A|nr:mucin-3A-like [Plodia interpunctella]
MRTVMGVKMNGSRWWLALVLQSLLLTASSGRSGKHHHHRRSMPTQATMPVSKSGWRPVLSSGGVLYGTFAGAHQSPAYKIPVPVLDLYPSSSRPLVARDATKLTSIAQSYRPTTLRTVSAAPPAPPANQPINSYHNPFAVPNGYTYKYIQNIPLDSVLIRNPQHPFAARPVFKYPPKIKPSYHNTMLQQLTNIQPIHFGPYPGNKPLEFAKPVEGYARPEGSKQSHGTEVFKPEVYKLSDSDTASQSISQQVKTAQQTFTATPKTPAYSHYTYQDAFPPSILGTFGSFGVQSVKARDPVFPPAKTTYLPPQPTKQTIFNSFSFSPSYKTPAVFSSTTPKLQTTLNQLNFGFNDYKTPTQQTKVSVPVKIDPNAQTKVSFKPSPQDPFINKHLIKDYNKVVVTTYNPIQTTTLSSNFFDFGFPSQHTPIQTQNFNNYDTKKQKIHDSFTAGGNQVVSQVPQHYTSPPKLDINSVSSRPTYEVIETTDSGHDIITHSSPPAWTYQSYDNPKSTEPSVTKQYLDSIYGNPTSAPDLPDEYAIVTEGEKGYQNSLTYDGHVESQSSLPLSNGFEPIGKHKLKDYYYKVSTTSYDTDDITTRRTKNPTDAPDIEVTTTHFDITNDRNNEKPTEALPTLPPNRHFKRPSPQDPLDKDKIRKRNKNRRRRPPLANISNNTSSTTRKYYQTTTETSLLQTTEPVEIHTIKPRVRPFKLKGQPNLTTPSITTDLTTSALPTISPTIPTLIKKKLVRRPFTTTTERLETTTQVYRDSETSNDSQIMKIANRPSYSKLSQSYEYRSSETPDYSHKQDEKDTPTSDIAVNLSETTIRHEADQAPAFAFHKDVKPIEAKLETTTESAKGTEAPSEATTASLGETPGRVQRPRLKNKFNRPKFSVKDYRNRLNSTTSTTEKTESKVRFPQRRVPGTDNYFNTDVEVTTERKKFMPKDPRHKSGNNSDNNEQTEKEIHSIRPQRTRPPVEATEASTQKISARIRNGQRRPKPTEEYTETSPTTVHSKRPLRKKIKDSSAEETQDIPVTETTVHYDKNAYTSERTRSESAIMKIADKKHQDHHLEHVFEHSKRVSDLTLAASKDYNTPGMFKTVSSSSRRIPNYFTIATDDPILPIEAFFPQLNQKKDT